VRSYVRFLVVPEMLRNAPKFGNNSIFRARGAGVNAFFFVFFFLLAELGWRDDRVYNIGYSKGERT